MPTIMKDNMNSGKESNICYDNKVCPLLKEGYQQNVNVSVTVNDNYSNLTKDDSKQYGQFPLHYKNEYTALENRCFQENEIPSCLGIMNQRITDLEEKILNIEQRSCLLEFGLPLLSKTLLRHRFFDERIGTSALQFLQRTLTIILKYLSEEILPLSALLVSIFNPSSDIYSSNGTNGEELDRQMEVFSTLPVWIRTGNVDL